MVGDPKDLELIARMAEDPKLREATAVFMTECERYRYEYNWTWLGRPIIQHPEDMVALQEIIWKTRPELIVETGIAHGGSLIFHASILELIGGPGEVLGIDIEIRPHNRVEIERHPMFRRIRMLEGSSIDPAVVEQVRRYAEGRRTMVILDSNHSHAHVLEELRAYSPLVSPGCYFVVLDTIIEFITEDTYSDRPWSKGNNTLTALREWLPQNADFEEDLEYRKLLITVGPEGYLRRKA
ncbi:MAG: cephalosporin hydroxylase family protein [Candidatus Eremiobacteraeota bacterium]|nr:cephalosporin hydroxylase family protein [Candidatus Eremiobacteraeota bacterium]